MDVTSNGYFDAFSQTPGCENRQSDWILILGKAAKQFNGFVVKVCGFLSTGIGSRLSLRGDWEVSLPSIVS